MREGGLDAPTRHVIPWEDPDFFDRVKTEAEMRRIFDICHGCRRCFNLCDAFPRLFDLVDSSDTGELARFVGPLANWGSDRHNQLTRPVLEKIAQVDRSAALPKYHGRTFVAR